MECDNTIRKESSKRGRKPGRRINSDNNDASTKLERSRQSARECRARKKLRYQYLEELVNEREKVIITLRKELEKYRKWSMNSTTDLSNIDNEFRNFLIDRGIIKNEIELME